MDVESNIADEPSIDTLNNKKNKKNDKYKKKTWLYLQPTRIIKWFEENSKNSMSGRCNKGYILDTTSIYDEWVPTSYELQVWQVYLKMDNEKKHWAKEVVQRTKKHDDLINSRFIQKKINRLTTDIAQANTVITDVQIQLGMYWTQTLAQSTAQANAQTTAKLTTQLMLERISQTLTQTIDPIVQTTNKTTATNRDRLEKSILRYIQHCTQHVKKMAETRIQLAKAQMEKFKALEDFQQIASPLQWNIHSMLKPKMKIWNTKNKNYRIAAKCVEEYLPPNFISKIDLSFKIDETIVDADEAQGLYNQMRHLAKNLRTQGMSLYLQWITREGEILTDEIERIIDGFPNDVNQEVDSEPGFAAFKNYHELRRNRFNLEAEQSMYFLLKQRVEGDVKEKEEEEILRAAPTLIRSLGEDFSLQQ
jgi:hypothetical protein